MTTPDHHIGFTGGTVEEKGQEPRTATFEVQLANDTFYFRGAFDEEQRHADVIADSSLITYARPTGQLVSELVTGRVADGVNGRYDVELDPEQLMSLLDTQINAEQGVTMGDLVRYEHRSRTYAGEQLPPLAGDPQATVEVKALRSDGVHTSPVPVPATVGVGVRSDRTVLGEVTTSPGGYDVFTKNIQEVNLASSHSAGIVLTSSRSAGYVMVPADELERAFNAMPDPTDPRRSLADGARAAQGLAAVQRSFDAGTFPKAGSLDSPTTSQPQPQRAQSESELSERFEALLDRMTYQEDVVQAEFHGLGDEEALVRELYRSRRDATADMREDTVDLGAVVDELQTASTRFDERFADLGYAMPDAVPSRKDRFTRAYEALNTQNADLAARIEQWNPANPVMQDKIRQYTSMSEQVDEYLHTVLASNAGDRDKAAGLIEHTSARFEPYLVDAGVPRPKAPVALAATPPVYEPTSLRPTNDRERDSSELSL